MLHGDKHLPEQWQLWDPLAVPYNWGGVAALDHLSPVQALLELLQNLLGVSREEGNIILLESIYIIFPST